MFKSVLISNRGEIACRIARTARRLGLRIVAVYSEADAGAPFVRLADEAHLIGPPQASESYLAIDRLISMAQRAGADCIHPGYGFLSENPLFAEAFAPRGVAPRGAFYLLVRRPRRSGPWGSRTRRKRSCRAPVCRSSRVITATSR